jgi:L-ascorbate metabolism protein UlaG (beta-lactamase superfamily)
MGHETHLIVPHGSAKLFRRHGFRRIEEVRVDDTTTIGGLTIKATYAKHTRFRFPLGLKADCLGFVIQGAYSIYFPGDTDYFPGMAHLADHLDVALLPVWGWGPTLGPGHLNPEVAARALTLLRPRLDMPIHWGSLHPPGLGRLNPRRFLTHPPYTFADHAAQVAPQVKVQIVSPGGSISLGEVLSA